jgi:release factor glutamine methyltransferase
LTVPFVVTWRELLGPDADALRAGGVESADLEARWIVEEAAGHDGAAMVAHLDDEVTERAIAYHDAMLARRVAGEPIQYVLGRWAFRSLDLAVDRRALIPRPETEQVVEVALAELDRVGGRDRHTRVVDLGTGTGAIALSITAERVRTEVWATDASPDALALARANLAGIGRAGARVRLLEGSWFEPLPADLRGRVDLVVSNPPYVPDDATLDESVERWEPALALRGGTDGLDHVRHILATAPTWLAPGAAVVAEIDPSQAEAAIRAAVDEGYVDVEVFDDLSGRSRAIRGRRRPGTT